MGRHVDVALLLALAAAVAVLTPTAANLMPNPPFALHQMNVSGDGHCYQFSAMGTVSRQLYLSR